MNKTPQYLLLSLFFLLNLGVWPFSGLQAQGIRLNEVVASNSSVTDENGETPDWIELTNQGPSSISLSGWSLTDDFTDTTKWVFPSGSIDPDSFLLVWAAGVDVEAESAYRTLISQGDTFAYLIPSSAPPTNWKDLSFSPTGWNAGPSGLGYGDGDDNTIVPNGTQSMYLRRTFSLQDTSQVEEIFLHMDYDDGFVAYLNGQEVARSNMVGNPPAFNDWSLTDQEAVMYAGQSPQQFVIPLVPGLLNNGNNVLAIQVHNSDPASSDLSIIPFLTFRFSGPSFAGISPPSILGFPGSTSALQTSFKLSSSGEGLYLFDDNQVLVDSMWIPGAQADISLGLSPQNGSLVYFSQPTPGAANSGPSYQGIILNKPVFSHEGGAVNQGSLALAISGAGAGEEIRYTLDASVPTNQSPLYSSPLNLSQTRVVRARIFKSGFISSPTNSRTYLFNANHNLPVVTLVTDSANFFSVDSGIYVLGTSNPGNFPYFGTNIWQDWERPIHFSLYEPNGNLGLAFNGGTKIFGGWSRANSQRSLSFFARKKYDPQDIDYPLFSTRPYTEFESFILRNSGDDWMLTNIRDIMMTSLLENSFVDIQAYQSVATYLNGEYWGMYNMREKINEHYLASLHGVDPKDVDILERDGEVIYGDDSEYDAMIDFLDNNSLTDSANYAWVANQIDLPNFFQYWGSQAFFSNTDWPYNNIKFWKAKGGKWRWVLFDTDYSFGIPSPTDYDHNSIDLVTATQNTSWSNPTWSTLVLRKLVENPQGRNAFINQLADDMNTRFLTPYVLARIDTIVAKVSNEMVTHLPRWYGNLGQWNNELQVIKNWAQFRPAYVKQHILAKWNLPAIRQLTVQLPDSLRGSVKLNSLSLNQSSWTGDYFDDVPVQVTAVPKPGYAFAFWSGDVSGTSPELTLDLDSNLVVIANFQPVANTAQLIINEINYNSAPQKDTKDWVEILNVSGQNMDLTGWELKDASNNLFVFPAGTQLAADSFLVVCRSLADFQTFYPNISSVVGDMPFGLSANLDTVRLFHPNGSLHNEVAYTSQAPWPTTANGQGPTLELVDPDSNNAVVSNWAALHAFGSPGRSNLIPDPPANNTPQVIINEINYKSSPQKDTKDWVELLNISGQSLDLGGWVLKDSDDANAFVFANGTQLPADSFLVVSRSLVDFQGFYPQLPYVVGDLSFGLGDSADAVRLFLPDGTLHDEVAYTSQAPWPTTPNGQGPSLELVHPDSNNAVATNWADLHAFGSPGRSNLIPDPTPNNTPQFIINEINYNSSPQRDTKDWVEILNISGQTLDLGGWVLKDENDTNTLLFPNGTQLPADSFLVVCRSLVDFQAFYPNVSYTVGDLSFGLGDSADAVRLFKPDGTLHDEVSYTSQAPWPTTPNGQGPSLELVHPDSNNAVATNWAELHAFGSPGRSNLIPDPTPNNSPQFVINEINYNSSPLKDTKDWVEILNVSGQSLDLGGWILKDQDDTNTFVFASGTQLPADSFLVVCRSLADFQTFYPNLSYAVGDMSFGLGDSADAVRLFKPDGTLHDEVAYTSQAPWPTTPNGQGPSLELVHPDSNNAVATNWAELHAFGSPGRSNLIPDPTPNNTPQVIINEINYNSAPQQDTKDWVELLNVSGQSLDLSGWVLRDNDDANTFLFASGTQLPEDSFLVVCRSLVDFTAFHPNVSYAVGDMSFGLGDSADAVRLFKPDGTLHDEVSYTSQAPWPTTPNGQGPTLELVDPDSNNAVPTNWAELHAYGSPGRSNLIPDPVPSNPQQVIINEINYNSSPQQDTKDWVELLNISGQSLDLSGWELKDNDDGNSFVFANGTQLPADSFLVVCRSLVDFQAFHPNLNYVVGEFTFGLGDSADAVRLFKPDGSLHDEVAYTSQAPWPTTPNGQGPTLELVHPDSNNAVPTNWAELHAFGSPGRSNLIPDSIPDNSPVVIINEINYKSAPQQDTKDWVELLNISGQTLDLSGWVLKDDEDANAFTFASGTQLPADSFLVVCRSLVDFQIFHPSVNYTVGNLTFGLGDSADAVRLFKPDGTLHDEVAYTSQAPWPTSPNGQGPTLELVHPDSNNAVPTNWAALHAFGSPGRSNLIPDPTPNNTPLLIINEINYKSSPLRDTDDWIEILNISDQDVDLTGWVVMDSDPTHVFLFDNGPILPADSFLVVCRTLTDFQTFYPNLPYVAGDLGFGLGSTDDTVRLYHPDGSLHDEVGYSSLAPWPPEANGQGPSLELVHPDSNNAIVSNWGVLHDFGSPGRSNLIPDPSTSIETWGNQLAFKVYPNPGENQVSLSGENVHQESLHIRLLDLRGKEIRSLYRVEKGTPVFSITVDVSTLSQGMYVIEVSNQYGQKRTVKWVKVS